MSIEEIYQSDPILNGLNLKLDEHRQAENTRIAQLQSRIAQGWSDVRQLKQQVGELRRRINARKAGLRAITRRTRQRKPVGINHRIASRKLCLRQREEQRLARIVRRQAILEFRKSMGLAPSGVTLSK